MELAPDSMTGKTCAAIAFMLSEAGRAQFPWGTSTNPGCLLSTTELNR